MKCFPLLQSILLLLHPRLQILQQASLRHNILQLLSSLNHTPDLVESAAQERISGLHIVAVKHDVKPLLVADPIVLELLLHSICILLRHCWSPCARRVLGLAYAPIDVLCLGVQQAFEL
jgi:hypothetical protein